jgi:hypothetical protein
VHSRAATQAVASDHTSLQRWAPEPLHVPHPWTSPPYRGELQCCHVTCGPGPRLLVELNFGAVMCSSAPGLTSLSRWAPALPRVPWLRDLPPERRAPALPRVPQLRISPSCRGGLRRCHVAPASPPRAESFGATTYPRPPSGLWTTGIKKDLAAPCT